MDKKKAFKILRQKFEEIPKLKELSFGNQDYVSWRDDVRDVIKAAFENNDFYDFYYADHGEFGNKKLVESMPYDVKQKDYLKNIANLETALLTILKKYEALGNPDANIKESPKVLIAHGVGTEARDKVHDFLMALGVQPLIIEEESLEGLSVNQQVEQYLNEADCAIILGTADDKELMEGKIYPGRNECIEIRKLQEKFPDRIMYLIEEGASFPPEISGILCTRFTRDNMEDAFISIAIEFRAYGILKAEKPEPKEDCHSEGVKQPKNSSQSGKSTDPSLRSG
jgi:predicted nucleotide-binding protein